MAAWIEFDSQATCLPASASSIKRSNDDCINLPLLTGFTLITFHSHANLNDPNTIENNILRRLNEPCLTQFPLDTTEKQLKSLK